MAVTDVNQRWQTEMAEFFEAAPGRRADEQMDSLAEVFHLA
jgi:L-rhamnose mutarotase